MKNNILQILFLCILSVNAISCDSGSSSDDKIVPSTMNSTPIADTGPDRTITTGSTVVLDGSASYDFDSGDTLSYSWSLDSVPLGSNASLSDAGTVNPSFTVDIDGTYILSLVVNDGTENSNTDHIVIKSLFVMLPQTGQAVCYDVSDTLEPVPCDGTGQDGESMAGVSWPIPRFTDLTPEITRDELTGLEWTRGRSAPGPAECLPNTTKIWADALEYIKCLNQNEYLGYSDWRLPNAVELSSLFNAAIDESFSDGFDQTPWGYWWTSTTRLNEPTNAYTSLAERGYGYYSHKTNLFKVWPVRSGSTGIVSLPQTGQDECFDSAGNLIDCNGSGQDGETMEGRQWPDPRFSDNGDGTMIDNLTGIFWTKDAEYPYSEICSPSLTDFQSAVNYIKCLNEWEYLGYNDWRLPNELEVRSLSNYGIPSSEKTNWLSTYGFYNFPGPYLIIWSATVEETPFFPAFPVAIWVGGGTWEFDYTYGHVWPVRGGIDP